MKFLSKLGDVVWAIVFCGIMVGLAFSFWTYASNLFPELHANFGLSVMRVGGLTGLAALIFFLEILYPLRSISRERWAYKDRPAGRMRALDGISFVQLGVIALLSVAVFKSLELPLVLAVVPVVLRAIIGWRNFSLSGLLHSGKTRIISTSGMNSLDSEVASNAIAAQCMRFRAGHPTGNLALLALRRLSRRYYIGIGAIALIGIAMALGPQLGSFSIVCFAAGWSVVGAATTRSASLGSIHSSEVTEIVLPLAFAVLSGVIGAGVVALLWTLSLRVLAVIAVSLAYSSFKRGKPARVQSISIIDSGGFGASFSPEVVGYFARGWLGIVAVGIALVL